MRLIVLFNRQGAIYNAELLSHISKIDRLFPSLTVNPDQVILARSEPVLGGRTAGLVRQHLDHKAGGVRC